MWVVLRPGWTCTFSPVFWGTWPAGEGSQHSWGRSVPPGVPSPNQKVGLSSTRVVLGRNSDAHGSEAGGWSWGGLTHPGWTALGQIPVAQWGVPASGDGSMGPDELRTLSTPSLHCVPLLSGGAGWMSWGELPAPTAVILLGVGFGAGGHGRPGP